MADKKREFTGKHALMVFVGAFAIIVSVNIAMAVNAVRTFPGLEVKNSYVASQSFNVRKAAQEALGWQVETDTGKGFVRIRITDHLGVPVQVGSLEAIIGMATHSREDITPEFNFDGRAYVANVDLGPGNWDIHMTATAKDGTLYTKRISLPLRDGTS
ncbi:FixH family protein [Chachezhania sediminis]|uniref:FixH family protein n=1 Tax=Chachezhania sediminis TaxID=2599291 RepID=UPI00131CCBC6|nr:FixH family protein [Chachezhania sediminis]